MTLNLSKQILIDHHAHLLRLDFLQLDAAGFRQAFSEARSFTQFQEHVQHSVSYLNLMSELGKLLDIRGEDEILRLRETMTEADLVNLLYDDASIGAFIIDDGFSPATQISLKKFAAMCQRPVYRCRRIESAIELAIERSTSFKQLESMFPAVLFETGEFAAADSEFSIVSLKCIAAYRGGLDLELISEETASADFARTKSSLVVKGRPRITRGALYHYLLGRAFALAQWKDIPVQLHCGIGDQDQDLRTANPLCFRSILESPRFAKTKFVFLHCYPYVREAAYLCSLYANVFMDVSLISFLAAPAVADAFHDALAGAPFSKILAATDGHSVPEAHWFGAVSLKRGLGSALEQMIGDGFVSQPEAEMIAARVLHENARALYRLSDLK